MSWWSHLEVAVLSSCIILCVFVVWGPGTCRHKGGPDILPPSWLHSRMTLSLLITCLTTDRDREISLEQDSLAPGLLVLFSEWQTFQFFRLGIVNTGGANKRHSPKLTWGWLTAQLADWMSRFTQRLDASEMWKTDIQWLKHRTEEWSRRKKIWK